VVAAFDGGDNTSDAGGLLLGATDRAIDLVARFAACFVDGRAQAQVEHTIQAMVAQRVFGIALGYEDLVDHDQLRHDPVLATLAGKLTARRKNCAPLAGKSTLNRLEHTPWGPSRYHKIDHDAAATERLFVELFLEAHQTPPKRSSSTLMPRMIPCTGTWKAAFSTATHMRRFAVKCEANRSGPNLVNRRGQSIRTQLISGEVETTSDHDPACRRAMPGSSG
jgi:hypothetical protein